MQRMRYMEAGGSIFSAGSFVPPLPQIAVARQSQAQWEREMAGVTKPITYLHRGKKVPKGFHETGRSIHLGKGIWLLRMRPNPGISARKAFAILSKLK